MIGLGKFRESQRLLIRISIPVVAWVLFSSSQVFGQIRVWNNSAADNDFANHANWTGSPGDFISLSTAQWDINLGVGANKAVLSTDIGNVVRDVRIGDAGTQGELEVTATGSMTITRDLRLARSGAATGQAIMTVNGGSVTVATVVGTGNIFIGQSDNPGNPTVLTLNSGSVTTINTLNVAHQSNNKGNLVINGGTFTAGNAVMADAGGSPSVATLTVTGGSLTTTTGGLTFASSGGVNTATVTLSGSGQINSATSMSFGFGANSTVNVNMTGGTLNAPTSFLTFGQGAGSNTTVTMSGGTINTDRFNIGNKNADPALPPMSAVLNMSGGTIEATADISSTAGNRGAFVLGSTVPDVNLSGTALVSAERLLINAGGTIDITGTALLHLKGSTIETAPGSGVLASTSPTFSFAQQFVTGLWAEVLGKVRLNEVGAVLRVEGESETIADPIPENPDQVLNYLALFNAAIANGVITTTLGPEFTLQASYDGVHTKVEVVSVASAPQYVGGHPHHGSFSGVDKIDTGVSLIQRGASLQTAQLTNIISSSQGINGVVLDFDELADLNDITLEYKMSPQNVFATPVASWSDVPAAPTATLLPNAGQAGSDRVLLTWANGTITDRYLCIKVIYDGNTIAELYLGHLRGEMTGASGGKFTVLVGDILAVRTDLTQAKTASGRTDVDKSGTVLVQDILDTRSNLAKELTQVEIPANP